MPSFLVDTAQVLTILLLTIVYNKSYSVTYVHFEETEVHIEEKSLALKEGTEMLSFPFPPSNYKAFPVCFYLGWSVLSFFPIFHVSHYKFSGKR